MVFGFIFFGIGRGNAAEDPGNRRRARKEDRRGLECAQAARAKADETEAAWRARILGPRRSRPARPGGETGSAKATEAKVKKAADKIGLKADAASAKIREAVDAARAEIEAVAAEASQEMVQRLTGIVVDKKEAAAAVKAELNV